MGEAAKPLLHLRGESLRVGIVAGEMSGDMLGAGLMAAIRKRYPDVQFVGIGGPAMRREGLESLCDMERLAVMGIVEVLKRLRELLAIRRQVVDLMQARPPDVFIGIDSPDFNLPVEKVLKAQGIRTVHYVSPSVWAWRQSRIDAIARSVDLMLTLFPFEERFYRQHDVPVKFVGHPLAHQIDMRLDHRQIKQHWGFSDEDKVVAVLPGSRGGELKFMGPLFVQAMRRLRVLEPHIKFIVPYANETRKAEFEKHWQSVGGDLPIVGVVGHAREVMAGADVVLVTSGTATLEAMLMKRPMVIAYRWGRITHAIISRMVKTPHIGLPNILAGERLVPEFVQAEATPEAIAGAVIRWFDDVLAREALRGRFDTLHLMLRQDANEQACEATLALLESR